MGVGGRLVRSEWMRAALVMVVAAVIFLWEPLTTSRLYGPGDITQKTPLLRTAPAEYEPDNWVQGDSTFQYMPWLRWNRDELRAGHLPLWNPYNASGVPHLANGQSAVFSPFSVPHYVLSVRAALVAAAFLQLVVAGMLSYGLLRHLRLSFAAGIVGGVGFAFCGSSALWLNWPLSDAAALVPGVVWGAGALAVAADTRSRLLGAAGMAAAIAVGLCAGHPETIFFGGVVALAFAVTRLVAQRCEWRELLRRIGWLGGAGALGAGLAAIQLIPLVEYINHSLVFDGSDSVNRRTFFSTTFGSLHTLPFVAGSPGHRYASAHFWPQFVEVGGIYTGATLLFLAGVGAFMAVRRRQRVPLFFVAVAGLWWLYGYDVFGLGALVRHVPPFNHAPPWRSAIIWQIAIIVLAGFGVDALRQVARDAAAWTGRQRIALSLAVTGWAVLLLAVSVWWAGRLRDWNPPKGAALTALADRTERDHIRFVALTLLISVVAGLVAVLVRRHSRLLIGAVGAALTASVLLQGPFMLRGFNPAVKREYFFARSVAASEIARVTRGEQTLGMDTTMVFPDMNLWYRWESPGNYDAMWVESFDDTYRTVLRTSTAEVQDAMYAQVGGGIRPEGLGGFRAMGIRYVTTSGRYPFGKIALVAPPPGNGGRDEPDRTARFSVVADGSAFNVLSVEVPAATKPGGSCRLTIVDVTTAETLRQATAPCAWEEAVFSFPELQTRAGQSLDLSVVPSTPDPDRPVATHRLGIAAYQTDATGLEIAARIGVRFRVFKVPGSPERYFSPERIEPMADIGETRERMSDPDFDPVTSSIVDTDSESAGDVADEPGQVEVVKETGTQIRLRVERETAGWLVALQTRYPGWHATVNGKATPISTANGTFLGVPVPEGESEVVLTFRPTSVVQGGVVSVVSALVWVAALVMVLVLRRREGPG